MTDRLLCLHCDEPLTGRQRKYCSGFCKDKQYYKDNKKHILKQKHKITFCIICNNPLPKRYRKYCSTPCYKKGHKQLNKQWRKNNRKHLLIYQKQWRKDNKEYLKQYYENNKELYRKRGKQHYINNREWTLKRNKQNRLKRTGVPDSFIELTLTQKDHRTDIEMTIEYWLLSNNISYKFQKRINLPTNWTYVDFFIEPNICLYCDGEYDHFREEVTFRDKRINKELKSLGFKVIRILGSDILNGIRPTELLDTLPPDTTQLTLIC